MIIIKTIIIIIYIDNNAVSLSLLYFSKQNGRPAS